MDRQHIDEVQAATVDEHMKLILNDETLLDPDLPVVTKDDLPDWYNKKVFKQAQDFYSQYVAAIQLNNVIGLITIFAIPQILKVLTYTKQSSTICLAYRRYIQTAIHTYKFYVCDPNDPNSDWYRSINVIRQKHKRNSNKCISAGIGGIYQRDMVLTQLAFAVYVFTSPKAIGISMNAKEAEAFNHLWRVTGYMLGISDRLNLCRKTAEETRSLCQKLIDNAYMKYLRDAPADFFTIASTTLDGLWYIDISVDREATMQLVYKMNGLEYKKPLRWYSWLNIKYRDIIISLSFVPYIGTVIRLFFNNLLRFIFWYSEHYGSLYAWLKYDKKDLNIVINPKIYTR